MLQVTSFKLNFLNLFEQRERKTILDPFVGNGTIVMFALIEDFQVFGTDIDETKVKNTERNVNWLLNELEESVPYMLNERIKRVDINQLSSVFEDEKIETIKNSKWYEHNLNEAIEIIKSIEKM